MLISSHDHLLTIQWNKPTEAPPVRDAPQTPTQTLPFTRYKAEIKRSAVGQGSARSAAEGL
jgi:hypothetical protein